MMTQLMNEITTVESAPLAKAEPPTIETILAAAMQLDHIPIDAIERLVALKERELDRKAEQDFNEALSAFRAEVPAIIKVKQASFPTKGGGQMKYNYAPLEEVTKVIDPILFRHGLTYHWDAKFDTKPAMIACTVHHVGGHKRTSCFPCDTSGGGNGSQSASQAMASAITFARRYALILALGITTDEDNDGRRAVPGVAPDADRSQPVVPTREQRKANADKPLVADDLNQLFEASGYQSLPEFVTWAEETLQCGGLDKLKGWNRQQLEYMWSEIEKREAGDANE